MYIYLPNFAYAGQAPAASHPMMMPPQGQSRIRRCEKIDEFPEIVSATFRGTDKGGSCIIRRNEYDVDENGGEDDAGRKDSHK